MRYNSYNYFHEYIHILNGITSDMTSKQQVNNINMHIKKRR